MSKSNDDTLETLKKIEAKRLAQQEKKKEKQMTSNLDNTAYDLIFDKETKTYSRVTIKYNPQTKEASVEDVVPVKGPAYKATFDFEKLVQKKFKTELI